ASWTTRTARSTAGWSSSGGRSRSSRTRPTPARRATSLAASAERHGRQPMPFRTWWSAGDSPPLAKSTVFQGDALADVADLLHPVDRLLDGLDDVLPPQHVEGVEVAGEQVGHRAAVDPVGLALEAVDRLELG